MMSQHILLFCGMFMGFFFIQQLVNVRFDFIAKRLPTTYVLSSEAKIHACTQNDEVARALYSGVRVLCWIMTRPENHQTRLHHLRATWTKRCNHVLYMSSQASDFPTVGLNVSEGRAQLYWKTIRAFQYVHEHHLQDADWFLKADDDTFVVPENLRLLLSHYDAEEPVYFGHKFRPFVSQGYMSGGAGYVLSREAVRRFMEGFGTGRCKHFSPVEDMALGKCMETMGVKAGDSRDLHERETFNPYSAERHLISSGKAKQDSLYSYYKTEPGPGCCADFLISFHYMKPVGMYMLDYYTHHLRPFGYQYRFKTKHKQNGTSEPKHTETQQTKVQKK